MSVVTIKRENWKGKYVYVAREKGKLKTWQRVRGSTQNLQSLKNKFKQSSTFKQNVIKAEKLNKKVKYIKYSIGTNVKGKKLSTQTGVKVTWFKDGKKIGVTYGHSNKNGNKQQAFAMAKQKAINNYNFFDYDEEGIKARAQYFKESFIAV